MRQTALAFALIVALAVPAGAQEVRILDAAMKLAAETPLALPQTDGGGSPPRSERRRSVRGSTWVYLAIGAAVVLAVVAADGARRPSSDGYGSAPPSPIPTSN